MPILKQVRTDRRNKISCFLLDYASDVTSQSGEDGIIRKVFEIIGTSSRWCVEFGAWDGRKFSNTYNLIQNEQWSGVLIEGAQAKFQKLKRTYANNPLAVCIHG